MSTPNGNNEPSLETTKRKLPHWRLPGSTYFITWRLKSGQPVMAPGECDVLQTALQFFHGSRYHLLAWVVMDDHVHVLVRPNPGELLSKSIHSWKSFTAKKLIADFGRATPVWQAESYDRIMRDEAELLEKAEYILTNPQRRDLAVVNYKWCGWHAE